MMTGTGGTRALIESNAREAADLAGELTLLLDAMHAPGPIAQMPGMAMPLPGPIRKMPGPIRKMPGPAVEMPGPIMEMPGSAVPAQPLAAARMVIRRLSDRLGQIMMIERLARAGGLRPDAWSPLDLVEELEHEAVSLAGERIAIDVLALDLVPQYWFFDRELVAMALHNALHSAIVYARARVTLEMRMQRGYLGFGIIDDAGSFPAELLSDAPFSAERGECNGNALGIHFARMVAVNHVSQGRRGHVELANRNSDGGTRFTLWLP